MRNEFRFTAKELREIIRNEWKWITCPICDGTGSENYDISGNDVKPGVSYDAGRVNSKCESCEGVGYIANKPF